MQPCVTSRQLNYSATELIDNFKIYDLAITLIKEFLRTSILIGIDE